MLFYPGLLFILVIAVALILLKPKSVRLRRWMWGLYGGGIAVFCTSVLIFAYSFSLDIDNPSAFRLPYQFFWIGLAGAIVGFTATIASLGLAIVARYKKQ